MAAPRKKRVKVEESPQSWALQILTELRLPLALLLLVATLAVAVVAVWQRVQNHVLSDASYRLDVGSIEITRQPVWIRSNLKGDVCREYDLTNNSLLDDGLVERVHQAFSLHPWVLRVERVQKQYPASIAVDLVYRRPVAMIEVAGGLLPIDATGVLLPSDDFSPSDARHYPRIAGIESHPRGPVGTNWGDPTASDAAKLAALLIENWETWQLQKLQCPPSKSGDHPAAGFQLVHASGAIIPWGSVPEAESANEPKAIEKIARLKSFFHDHAAPDAATLRGIDLTHRDVQLSGS